MVDDSILTCNFDEKNKKQKNETNSKSERFRKKRQRIVDNTQVVLDKNDEDRVFNDSFAFTDNSLPR